MRVVFIESLIFSLSLSLLLSEYDKCSSTGSSLFILSSCSCSKCNIHLAVSQQCLIARLKSIPRVCFKKFSMYLIKENAILNLVGGACRPLLLYCCAYCTVFAAKSLY